MKTATKKKRTAKPRNGVAAIRRQLSTKILTRGRVVVIGLGGIGLILSRYLLLFLAALKDDEFRVVLVDGDAFEQGNKYRMDVPDFDNKAVAAGQQFAQAFGRPGLHLRWVPEYVTVHNVEQIIRAGDCVVLAVDNHATRKLVSDRCRQLEDVVLISGGNDGVENGQAGTYGNLQIYRKEGGKDVHPSLDHFHPEIANPPDRNPAELECMELAAQSAPQMLFTNLAVASAMLNALWRLLVKTDQPMYDEACLDIFEAVCRPQYLL